VLAGDECPTKPEFMQVSKTPSAAPDCEFAVLLAGNDGDRTSFRDVNQVAVVLVAEDFEPILLRVLVEVGLAGLADAQLHAVLPVWGFGLGVLVSLDERDAGDEGAEQETEQSGKADLRALRHRLPLF